MHLFQHKQHVFHTLSAKLWFVYCTIQQQLFNTFACSSFHGNANPRFYNHPSAADLSVRDNAHEWVPGGISHTAVSMQNNYIIPLRT